MPILPRAQLFEFNDRDWVPESLRDTIVETLSRSLDWGGFLAPLAPVINLGADRILVIGVRNEARTVRREHLTAADRGRQSDP